MSEHYKLSDSLKNDNEEADNQEENNDNNIIKKPNISGLNKEDSNRDSNDLNISDDSNSDDEYSYSFLENNVVDKKEIFNQTLNEYGIQILRAKDYHESPDIWALLLIIIKNSLSYTINYFHFYLQFMITIIFIGNIYHDTSMINAFGLIHFILLLLNNFTIGNIVYAFEIVGDDYIKSKNPKAFGLYYQKTQLLSGMSSIIISLITFALFKIIVNNINIEPVSLDYMNDMINIAIVYPIFQIQNNIHYTYLKTLKKMTFAYVIIAIHIFLFVAFSFILILVSDLNLVGVGITYLVTNIITYISYVIYINNYKIHRESIVPWTKESFRGWFDILSKAYEITVFNFLEETGFELLTLIAYLSSSLSFTVYMILYSIYQLMYSFTWGLSKSCDHLSRIYISAGLKQTARTIFKICLITNSLITKFFGIVSLILLGVDLSYAFIIDQYVAKITSAAQYALIFALVFHSMQKLVLSFFNGCGWYTTVGLINIISYYLITIPFAICFAIFCKLGAMGIYISLILSNSIVLIVCWFFYEFYMDFNKVNKKLFINRINVLFPENDDNIERDNDDSDYIRDYISEANEEREISSNASSKNKNKNTYSNKLNQNEQSNLLSKVKDE